MTTDSIPTPEDASEPTTSPATPDDGPDAQPGPGASSAVTAGSADDVGGAASSAGTPATASAEAAPTDAAGATSAERAATPASTGSPALSGAPTPLSPAASSHIAPPSQTPPVNRHSLFARAEQAVSASAPTADSADAPMTPATGVGPAQPSPQSAESPAEPVTFASAWAQSERTERPARTPRSEDDIILDGSVTMSRPASRLGAHLLGVALCLTLIPFAWFFLHDAATGLITASVPPSSPPQEAYRFALDTTGLIELAVGVMALVLALWTARRSSVGAITAGVVSLAAGLPFLLAPTLMSAHVTPTLAQTASRSSLSRDLVTYLWADAASGRFVVGGILLVMIGVISHSARRAGRREQEIRSRAPHSQ